MSERKSLEVIAATAEVRGYLGLAQDDLHRMVDARANVRAWAKSARTGVDLAIAEMVRAGCSLQDAVDYVDCWLVRTQGQLMEAYGNPEAMTVESSPSPRSTARVPGCG